MTESSLELAIAGVLLDTLVGEEYPTVAIPDMPYHDSTNPAGFQAYISDYTMDSLFSSLLEVRSLAVWFNATEVPAWEDIPLTTTTVDAGLMPGIADYYGYDLPMDVDFNILTLHDFEVYENNEIMSVTGDVDMKFYVETAEGVQLAAEIVVHDLVFSGSALINNMNITLSVSKFNIGSISQVSCAFGTLHTTAMKLELNNVFRLAIPSVNSWLTTEQVSVPSSILGVFELSDLTLGYFDDYLFFGATPTFYPHMTEKLELYPVY